MVFLDWEIDGVLLPGRIFQRKPKTLVHATYPLAVAVILCKSLRHRSQKYSSGLMASSIIPTQPPCCHTLQMSHWMKRPPLSSCTVADETASVTSPLDLAFDPLCSLVALGIPGYSKLPQIQRVISSSSSSSSKPFWILIMPFLISS